MVSVNSYNIHTHCISLLTNKILTKGMYSKYDKIKKALSM